jgi:CRP/FNR family nitrogen fixation transcriptional regulator
MLAQTAFPTTTSTTLRDPQVHALLRQSKPSAVTFHPTDSVIYAQGEPTGPLYLVEFGTVRVCRMTADGRRQINSFHYAGDVFGFEAGDEHQSYAESVDGAGIRVIRAAEPTAFAREMLAMALVGLGRTQDHLLLLGRLSANERMAAFILDLMERQQTDDLVLLPMQRNDIADYLGMTFETVSRVLRVLKDRNIIRLPSVERIEVLDADALAAICH